jgi:hypothetical protein
MDETTQEDTMEETGADEEEEASQGQPPACPATTITKQGGSLPVVEERRLV